MRFPSIISILVCTLLSLATMGQDINDGVEFYLIDSLDINEFRPQDSALLVTTLKKYHQANHDTDRVLHLSTLCEEINHESWKEYQIIQKELIESLYEKHDEAAVIRFLDEAYAMCVNNLGYIEHTKNNFEQALIYYKKCLTIQEKLNLNDKRPRASVLANIGRVYDEQGVIPKALEYVGQSLLIYEQLKDTIGIAYAKADLAYLYKKQKELTKSREYFEEALNLFERFDEKGGIAECVNQLGNQAYETHEYPKALEYYKYCLEIRTELGKKRYTAGALRNVGLAYLKMDSISQALSYLNASLEIFREIEYTSGEASTLSSIARLYFETNDLGKALEYGKKADELAKATGIPETIKRSSRFLVDIYSGLNQGMEALESYKVYVQMKDSIQNDATKKAAIRQQTKYEFQMAQLVKEQQEKESERLEIERKERKNNLQYSGIGAGLFIMFILVFILGNFKLPTWAAELAVFLPFLILFEFFLVLSEPYIESISRGEPLYKLLCNAAIAGLIFPLHSLFERSLKQRIFKVK